MGSMNVLDDVAKIKIDNLNHMLGKGLMMPFAASNSGSRKLMFGTQLEHRLPLLHPEVPFIQTGYENQFGQYSSSFIVSDVDLDVIAIIPKYDWIPKHQYYIIAVDQKNGILRVIERKEYKHITENYGYLYDNDFLDKLGVGSRINEGTTLQKSQSFDEYNNRMDGCNMLTMYAACEETMEDAIIISESASKKLASPLVKKVTIVINDNDIPLNLYGDIDHYKSFPNIGEETVNSILCGLRREKKEECLFSQSYARLRELSISDERYTVSGRVVDINVYCNAPDRLSEYEYNTQLKMYYDHNLKMCNKIVEAVKPWIDKGYKMEYDLQRLYSIASGTIQGKQYFSERAFSNIVLEITLVEEIEVLRGDKLSNRYGGKGITARVRPDALMPKTRAGDTIEVILNMCGVYGRENAGQLFEITVSYICKKIIEFCQTDALHADECIDLYLTLLEIVSPSMAEYMDGLFSTMDDDEAIAFIGNIIDTDKSFYIAIEPMSENMTIDKVNQLYEAFPWAKPEPMMMPIIDSAGEIQYIPSRRPMVYGYQYIYRLKQYAEEKFSVTSLSATNIRNENSKSKNSNNYKALYSKTPIRFGDMETGNLIHLGAELVVQMLMLYSTSPHARRLASQMLTCDPFKIDVKLDDTSINRNVEILNAYLKTMGLRLSFKKTPKKLIRPALIDPVSFFTPPEDPYIHPISPIHPDEKFDIEAECKRLLSNKKYPALIHPVSFFIPMEEENKNK